MRYLTEKAPRKFWDPTANTGAGGHEDYTQLIMVPIDLSIAIQNLRGGAIGASMIFDRGYAGMSYAKHQTKYGSPLESAVSIDMDNDRFDFASEIRDLGSFFDRAKFRAAYTDYIHKEIEDGAINTTFKNQGVEGTFELGHQPVLGIKGDRWAHSLRMENSKH